LKTLALFDLDNTLLSGDSDYAWGQYLIDQGVVDRQQYETQNDAFYTQYKQGSLDIHAFLAFALAPLAQHSPEQLAQWHRQFMREYIHPIMGEAAKALVRQHLDAGHLCAIITATNDFVTAPIASAFGVPHLIATLAERDGARFTGRAAGIPCFREGKIQRLHAWLQSRGESLDSFADSVFYSDSLNDLPLLNLVKRPIAVDPDPTLAQEAQRRGWPTISLR
jgi:HAD superfamily hydrolase (TIGR01490 family)